MLRASFETVDYQAEVIRFLSPSAEIFCDIWVNYLESVGWTEIEYEIQFERRAFDEGAGN